MVNGTKGRWLGGPRGKAIFGGVTDGCSLVDLQNGLENLCELVAKIPCRQSVQTCRTVLKPQINITELQQNLGQGGGDGTSP